MTAWPVVPYDYSEKTFPPYTREVRIFAATNVRFLIVRVELNRNEVVSIQPGPGAEIIPGKSMLENARPTEHPD